jgi:hypothetical protein
MFDIHREFALSFVLEYDTYKNIYYKLTMGIFDLHVQAHANYSQNP